MTQRVDKGAKVNAAVLEALKGPRKADTPAAPAATPSAAQRPLARTWVGRVADEHNSGLKARVQQLEQERADGLVVLRLDPKRIEPSALANRHATSLVANDEAFQALTQAIRTHGQLEPIRVRPAADGSAYDYEIVYGHRRHAVTLALDAATEGGWPVLAVLDASASDARDHVLKMYQENAARKDLSAYETGAMFRSWLEAGVFADQTAIAGATGLGKQTVSKYLQVAQLPDIVVAAFGNPTAIAVRWAELLVAALKAQEHKVLAVAQELVDGGEALAPDVVLRKLIDAGSARPAKRASSQSETVKIDGRTAFAYALKNDRIAIRFGKHVDRQAARELTDEIKDLLTRRLKARMGRGEGS
jgi:ParB family chromosome partitioning protein